MDKHIALADLQKALDPKYKISALHHNEIQEQAKSWLETYKPILLIFFYISLITVLIQFKNEKINVMEGMQHFMAGFFLVFSFYRRNLPQISFPQYQSGFSLCTLYLY